MKTRPRCFPIIPLTLVCVGSFAACGTTVETGGGGSGGSSTTSTSSTSTSTSTSTTTSTSTSTSTGTSTSTSSSTSSSGSTSCVSPAPLSGVCAPTAVCKGNGSTCVAHVQQSSSAKPGFRMAGIAFSKPAALTTGIVSSVFEGSTAPADPACNITGAGTFSWLLRFDLAAGTLTTGGAKPSSDPAGPYAFVDEMVPAIGGIAHIQPVTLTAPLADGCSFDSSAGDVMLPVYLDQAATSLILLPLRALRFVGGAISPDLGCIGRFNAEGLDPANSCLPTDNTPAFLPAASIEAMMTLEDADTSLINPLSESLCVLLSSNAAMFGVKNAQGITVCKRDAANQIVFKGDWCASTNQPATAGCADAVRMTASFAAQAVKIQ